MNVQKVAWCIAELGLEIERTDIGGEFGGNDKANYLSKNPNGKIPTLIDEGYVLWESNAIVRYLCEQYGTKSWYPKTARDRGHAGQWMDWYQTTLHGPMTTLFWQLIRTEEANRNDALIASAIAECANFWRILDDHLAQNSFVLGDEISMADIPIGCAAYRWHSMQFDRPDLPALKVWWNSLAVRPAYQKHVMLPLT